MVDMTDATRAASTALNWVDQKVLQKAVLKAVRMVASSAEQWVARTVESTVGLWVDKKDVHWVVQKADSRADT